MVCVYNLENKSKVVGPIKSGGEVILDCDWSSETVFVTIGIKHYYAWDITKQGAKNKGIFGKGSDQLCTVASARVGEKAGDMCVAAANGRLQIWKGANNTQLDNEKEVFELAENARPRAMDLVTVENIDDQNQ
jgi:hypothetical protein